MPHRDGPFYVIVGLGFSAVLNHLLLRTTKTGRDRVDNLPVLHIGLPDPWSDCAIDRMGQWPCLLILPKFANSQRTQKSTDFLSCNSFAEATRQELLDIATRFPNDEIRTGVVEDVSEVAGDFKVTFADVDGKRSEVTARKVDFCTGLGPPHKLTSDQVDNAVLRKEYFDEAIAPNPRRLTTAVDFLKSGSSIVADGLVCIYGDGGTSAWCVERALRSNLTKEVLWVSRKPFSADTFPSSGRNDHLVKSFSRNPKTLLPAQKLTANDSRLRLAWGYQIERLDLNAKGAVEICFLPFPLSQVQSYVDHRGNDLGSLKFRDFSQVVVSIGQTHAEGRGCLEQLTKNVMRKKHPLASHTGLLAGFADDPTHEHARVRILGPAITGVAKEFPSAFYDALTAYTGTLARQADGAQIVTGALSVAQANGFFCQGRPNTNINTADLADLKQLGVDSAVATNLIFDRRQRVEPFTELPRESQLANLKLYYGDRDP
jgi:hypothetical protein